MTLHAAVVFQRPRHPTSPPTLPASFEFSNGKLRCGPLDTQQEGVPPGTLETDLRIERFVVLGLPKDADAYEVHLQSAGSSSSKRVRLEARRGGAHPLLPERQGHALVVRAGGAPVGRDWEMSFEAAAAVAGGAGRSAQV